MAGHENKSLTNSITVDIILSDDEKRILLNLRKLARMYEYGSLTAVIDFHAGTLSKGRASVKEIKL